MQVWTVVRDLSRQRARQTKVRLSCQLVRNYPTLNSFAVTLFAADVHALTHEGIQYFIKLRYAAFRQVHVIKFIF